MRRRRAAEELQRVQPVRQQQAAVDDDDVQRAGQVQRDHEACPAAAASRNRRRRPAPAIRPKVPSGVNSSTKRVTWIIVVAGFAGQLAQARGRVSPSLTRAKPTRPAKKITCRIVPLPARARLPSRSWPRRCRQRLERVLRHDVEQHLERAGHVLGRVVRRHRAARPRPRPAAPASPTARPTPTASTAVIANQRNVRPPSAAIDFCPCSAPTALITAKNTSGIAIILIRLT